MSEELILPSAALRLPKRRCLGPEGWHTTIRAPQNILYLNHLKRFPTLAPRGVFYLRRTLPGMCLYYS